MPNTTNLEKLCSDLSELNQNARELLKNFSGLSNAGENAQEAVREALESLNTQIEEKMQQTQNFLSQTQEDFERLKQAAQEDLAQLGEDLRNNLSSLSGFDYKRDSDPSATINPAHIGALWINTRTLEIFSCIDNTHDNNLWLGSKEGSVGSLSVPREAGSIGFGVGIAPDEVVQSLGLNEMVGTKNPYHKNFGNYEDATGSIMVWIPKMYVKKSHIVDEPYLGLKVELSATQKEGFVLPQCFMNAGVEIDGLFVDKYLASAEQGIAVSKRYAKPISTHISHNPISALGDETSFPNRYDTAYKAAKTRGAKYCIPQASLYTYLCDLGQAHFQRLFEAGNGQVDLDKCAWGDKAPYAPRGLDLGAKLQSYDDSSIKWDWDGYTYSDGRKCGLTGGVSEANLPKITHNGQSNGIVDITGLMWEIASGYITGTTGKHYFIKDSTDLRDLSDGTLAYTLSYYDEFSNPLTLDNKTYYFGNGTIQVFSGETNRATTAYKLDQLGLPRNDDARSTSGELRYGQDGFWAWQRNEMSFIVGGSWADTSRAGVWARTCSTVRTSSNHNVGFRTCLIP
ncbi:hypothetical protein [Helicobacter sp. UBA3407]|uniref:hypothetical protein n=1 Tax=Helicobacter TaxID=209 RepID=UPI0026326125|nr:hypothetical protein [Helicobacter sp. UBA3407]